MGSVEFINLGDMLLSDDYGLASLLPSLIRRSGPRVKDEDHQLFGDGHTAH